MTSLTVPISDSDVVKMIEEYLENRHLDIALMCLERESGIINGVYSEDALFLRQLILDGQWDDALEFLQPLEMVEEFNIKSCQYLIYKHKYLEQLCIKQDPGPLQNHQFTLDEVVSCLTALEDLTDRHDYDQLCFLLTLPSLSADPQYKNWNPSSARLHCFNQLYPLLKKFIGTVKKSTQAQSAKNDRLLNLLVKGLLYELSVELCTSRACGSNYNSDIGPVLGGSPCMDADLSLISWLQQVPAGSFACPFEKKTLRLNLQRLEKPALEALWSEQLLSTPIRPKQFPHNAIPARTKSAQFMSNSMMSLYDGLNTDLNRSSLAGSFTEPKFSRSIMSSNLSRSLANSISLPRHISRSLHVDRRSNPMNRSLEQLFVTGASPRLSRGKSPLTRDSKQITSDDIISPPSTQTSSMERSDIEKHPANHNHDIHTKPTTSEPSPVSQSHHNHIDHTTKNHQPISSQLSNNTPIRTQSSPPISSQRTNNTPIRTQGSPPISSQRTNNTPIRTQGSPPISSHLTNNTPIKMQSSPPISSHLTNNTPIKMQSSQRINSSTENTPTHSLRQSSNQLISSPVNHSQPMRSSGDPSQPVRSCGKQPIRESNGDLFIQYKEQKERIAEKFKELEEREEEWKSLHNDVYTPLHNDVYTPLPPDEVSPRDPTPPILESSSPKPVIPQLNLDISVNQTQPDIQSFDMIDDESIKQFVPVETLVEQAPIRAIAFHPTGNCYAVGSNTKVLRVCQFPDVSKITTNYNQAPKRPTVLAKKIKHHSGSIYCVAFNPSGSLIATGSNDHMIKCTQWLSDQTCFGTDREISAHDGTIRDVAFIENHLLLSGGAGDCSICLTDVNSNQVIRRYRGHNSNVLSLFPLYDNQRFVSGGQDNKSLLWDTRMSVPIQTFSDANSHADAGFTSVCTDPRSLVLAAGHDNSHCSIFDLRQSRLLQTWKPHTDEIRSVRFNSDATYFLTGSYDTTVKLMDMQGDITQNLRTVQVAEHSDKVIQVRCHPILPSFITSSADRTVTCWAIQIDP